MLPEDPGPQPAQSAAGEPPPRGGACGDGPGERELLVALATLAELPTVPPPRFFGQVGTADPDDLERPMAEQGDIVGLVQEAGLVRDQLLQLLQRFPPVLERREIPPFARRADGPEPPLQRVEGDPSAVGEVLEGLVGGEGRRADQTTREQLYGPP